jgi:multidrug efflux pump subunit AcrA (membrane-fusion protein)
MSSGKILLLVATIVVLLGIGAGWYYFSHKANETTAAQQPGKKILFYRDPMDPSMVSDKPGKSPMGMEMVPVYEGEQGGGVSIDPTVVQNIGVRYERARRRMLTKTIRTSGKIDYDERRMYAVSPKISGWVEKLYVNYTGKTVRKGEPLLDYYSPDLLSAQGEYLIAWKNRRDSAEGGTTTLLARTRQKLQLWDISDAQIHHLETTQVPEKTMSLLAPESGIVVEKNVIEGANVMAGTTIFRIADLSTVWVNADVFEYEAPAVKIGQRATVSLSYLPGKTYIGRVAYIYPYLNPETRTLRVRIELQNPHLEFKPEMYTTVELRSTLPINAVTVPEQAVIHSGERNVVVVSRGNNHFESRDVTLGMLADGYYQVLDGINEGDSVVVSSQFLIDSESNLKTALSQMKPGASAAQDSHSH